MDCITLRQDTHEENRNKKPEKNRRRMHVSCTLMQGFSGAAEGALI